MIHILIIVIKKNMIKELKWIKHIQMLMFKKKLKKKCVLNVNQMM